MANQTTKIADLINPQVMADMISAKVSKKIIVAPFAKVDDTLVGVPGNTITVPKYGYIGDAEDIAEGVAAETVKLSTSTTTATVKKAMKAVELTDESVLSGYGNPVGETNNQLAKAIASKVDNDSIEALMGATLVYDGTGAIIAYNSIVDAVDLFDEEVNSPKAMFIHPNQVTKLRKDSNFISADKYGTDMHVMLTGEIGDVANCRIVPTKKVPLIDYTLEAGTGTGIVHVVAADATTGEINRADTAGKGVWDATNKKVVAAKTGDYIKAVTAAYYLNPIVKLNNDSETEEDAAAITVYLKKDTSVETERDTLARKTDVSVDKHYTVALTNESKVVLAKIKK